MKNFIIYSASCFCIYLTLLECTTRFFDLSGHTIPEANIDNDRLILPNAEGIWVKGGMREISSHYKINNQGFNSLKDYSELDENKISIAIIGDSYIEGFHVDVEKSIGRILETESQNLIEVHEYGISGGNIVDFSLIFEKYIRNKYDYTFILMTDKDIASDKAVFMGRGKDIPKKSVIREIYNHLSFIRYLNINHGLSAKLKKVFSLSNSSGRQKKSLLANNINSTLLKEFDESCFILYEKEKLDADLIKTYTTIPCIEIVHQFTPYTHGFDSHWNLNGRKNCALTIKHHIQEIEGK